MAAKSVCQFFLRGRCQREKCEFSHDLGSKGPAGAPAAVVVASKSKPTTASVDDDARVRRR